MLKKALYILLFIILGALFVSQVYRIGSAGAWDTGGTFATTGTWGTNGNWDSSGTWSTNSTGGGGSPGGGGTVTVDAVGTPHDTNGSASSLTFSATIGSGTDRLLVVTVSQRNISGSDSVSAVTYGGSPMTLLISATSSNGSNVCSSYIYYIKNPSVGTANVVVTFGAGTEAIASSVSFFGVNQTTPFFSSDSQAVNDTSTAVSLTLSSQANDIGIDAYAVDEFSSGGFMPTPGDSQTTYVDQANADETGGMGQSYKSSSSTSLTMSWDTPGASSGFPAYVMGVIQHD